MKYPRHTLLGSTDLAAWLRVVLSTALGLVLVWVLAPGIATVWAGTAFEATTAAFLLAFVLFAPLALLAHLLVYLVAGGLVADKPKARKNSANKGRDAA